MNNDSNTLNRSSSQNSSCTKKGPFISLQVENICSTFLLSRLLEPLDFHCNCIILNTIFYLLLQTKGQFKLVFCNYCLQGRIDYTLCKPFHTEINVSSSAAYIFPPRLLVWALVSCSSLASVFYVELVCVGGWSAEVFKWKCDAWMARLHPIKWGVTEMDRQLL